jgi:hypothetical protein
MDKAVVEQALKALAEIGATQASVPEPSQTMSVNDSVSAERSELTNAPCGSPDCAACYDIGDERKIHPPKCGSEYRKWLERWQPKGKPQ